MMAKMFHFYVKIYSIITYSAVYYPFPVESVKSTGRPKLLVWNIQSTFKKYILT